MIRGRKALIGWVTYTIGKRVLKQMVKRKAKARFGRILEADAVKQPARRRLPLLGAGLALAAAAAAFVLRSRRGRE
jgi:hypothetical protein